MPRVAVVIPARWGSTRFPGKPLHPIAGKPLIQHVWERSARAKGIDDVVVATDDMRIAEAAFQFGAEVALTSKKHRSGTDRISEVAERMKKVTHLINVQGDEPLIEPTLIAKLAKELTSDRKVAMITAAHPIEHENEIANPNAVKVVLDREGYALYFSRSAIPFVREKTVPFYRHHGIYGYTRACLQQFVRWRPGRLEQSEQLEQLRALENGTRIRVLVTRHAAIGVDVPGDVERVEELLRAR